MYFEVFQLPDDHPRVFGGCILPPRILPLPPMGEYRRVYVGEIALDNNTPQPDEHERVLGDIFRRLNLNYHEEFHIRSLSVSDLVRLDAQYVYYCDSAGWVPLFGPETVDDCGLRGLIVKLGSVVLERGNEHAGVIDHVYHVLGRFPARNVADAERIIKTTVSGAGDPGQLVRFDDSRWFTQSALAFAAEHPGRAIVGMWLERGM